MKKRPIRKKIQYINFVKSGQMSSTNSINNTGVLCIADDWQMEADLNKQLKFPEVIAITNKRPDIVLWSVKSRSLVIVELTVPWEDRMETSNELKT